MTEAVSRSIPQDDANKPTYFHHPDHQGGWRDRVVERVLDRAAQRSLERGQSFIDAAIELVEDESRSGFTVQEVADRAGQSLRTLYQHFQSKDDLLLAVFEEQVKHQTVLTREAVDRHRDPVERLAVFIVASTSTEGLGAGSALTRYRMQLAVSRPRQLALVQAPYVTLALELITDAMDTGAIPPGNPEVMTYIITTLKSAYLHSARMGNELGVQMPTPVELAQFCLEGVGGSLPRHWTGLPELAQASSGEA